MVVLDGIAFSGPVLEPADHLSDVITQPREFQRSTRGAVAARPPAVRHNRHLPRDLAWCSGGDLSRRHVNGSDGPTLDPRVLTAGIDHDDTGAAYLVGMDIRGIRFERELAGEMSDAEVSRGVRWCHGPEAIGGRGPRTGRFHCISAASAPFLWQSRYVAAIIPFEPDRVDTAILKALQANGRQSIAELARHINMSHSAAAERVRRLEESGVISGYGAHVDPERLGFTILAFLRLRYPSSSYGPLHRLLADLPEVTEAHHVTGDDCFIMKVVATNMKHLEQISGRIGALGSVTTSVVYSSPLPPRPLLPPN